MKQFRNTRLALQLWILILILLFFELGWESAEPYLSSVPVLQGLSQWIGNRLLTITPALLNPLFDLSILRDHDQLLLSNGFSLPYSFHLSGIKQLALVLIMVLILPGPWHKKPLFIISCWGIIGITVIFRMVLLTLHCVTYPEHIHLIQVMLFGPVFYLEILVMWAVWVLLIAHTASLQPREKNQSHP